MLNCRANWLQRAGGDPPTIMRRPAGEIGRDRPQVAPSRWSQALGCRSLIAARPADVGHGGDEVVDVDIRQRDARIGDVANAQIDAMLVGIVSRRSGGSVAGADSQAAVTRIGSSASGMATV